MLLPLGEIFSDGCDAATGAASIRSLKRDPCGEAAGGSFSMQGSTVSAEIADAGSSYIFSRALTEGLADSQTDDEFNEMLKESIQAIYDASIA